MLRKFHANLIELFWKILENLMKNRSNFKKNYTRTQFIKKNGKNIEKK